MTFPDGPHQTGLAGQDMHFVTVDVTVALAVAATVTDGHAMHDYLMLMQICRYIKCI